MSTLQVKKAELRLRRKKRIRSKITGVAARPRLSVFKSDRHVYVQVIDDTTGTTLASASSFEKGAHARANLEVCTQVGKRIAERCKARNIGQIVFDKNGFQYHGRIKAVADGAREGGLDF